MSWCCWYYYCTVDLMDIRKEGTGALMGVLLYVTEQTGVVNVDEIHACDC